MIKSLFYRTICRICGHKWRWPEIVVFIDDRGQIREGKVFTVCERCGCPSDDSVPLTPLHIRPLFQGPVVGFSDNPKFKKFGGQINKMMGWE